MSGIRMKDPYNGEEIYPKPVDRIIDSESSPDINVIPVGHGAVTDYGETLSRISESARKLSEHADRAVNTSGVKTKNAWHHPSNCNYSPVSEIIITGRNLSNLNHGEDILRIVDKGNRRHAILLGDYCFPPEMKLLTRIRFDSRIDTHLAECSEPGHVLNQLNMEILRSSGAMQYMTAVVVFVDLKRRYIQYSAAGHLAPLHLRWRGAGWKELNAGDRNCTGIPLGIRDNEMYRTFTCKVGPGDKVLLVSDGFSKINGPGGKIRNTAETISSFWTLPTDAAPYEIMEGLEDIVQNLSDGSHPADEITATLIQL